MERTESAGKSGTGGDTDEIIWEERDVAISNSAISEAINATTSFVAEGDKTIEGNAVASSSQSSEGEDVVTTTTEDSAIPVNNRGLAFENHWGKVDYDVTVAAEKLAESSLNLRAVYHSPERTEIRSCLAPPVQDETEEEDGEEDEVCGGGGLKGFVQKPDEPWKISRQYFPSKAGGVPAWLDPVNVPRAKQGLCGICDKPMQFVLQVYAPVDDDESAFHRTLYVFICTSLACLQQDLSQQGRKENQKRSVKVLRNQLPRENDHYSNSPPKSDGTESPLGEGAPLCTWCGTWKGDKICGGCKQTRYCSQTHQMDHWRDNHAPTCRQAQEKLKASTTTPSTDVDAADSPSTAQPVCPNLWPEFELIVDDTGEDNQEDSDDELHARDRVGRLLSEYENRRRQGRDQFTSKDVQDVEESSAEEQHWAAFQARVSKTPEQVIWYLRSANAKPLWPRLDGQPKDTDIPVCSHCGGNRNFEFQILPQLLYFFQVKDDPDSLDWGTIAVYSCPRSCAIHGYSEEFAWVQPGFS